MARSIANMTLGLARKDDWWRKTEKPTPRVPFNPSVNTTKVKKSFQMEGINNTLM